ncbi:TetR/AcrR family transcriptional regulator [Paenibacillus physcomitrellae]|uniref:HTH tetR-type domain-containing protein n=1 Tax=Paenibacillus physcomitrellae TaxID=1619311 RepID=A0ABQ1FQV3_9BACL|nr:TetR/AcrR family transcriptional regulator [Paenibacillus physcomitrellae]GGA24578.1 hypothetical protein GCM10010917_06810 [Paenibacillus physcomitrellae]
MFNETGKDVTTKDHILNTALELIKAEGFENVTLRKIASCADVNLALINYYFGSKDKLINEVLKFMLAEFHDHFLILDDLSIPPKQRLKLFMKRYAASLAEFPELMKEILGKGNLSFQSHYEYLAYMKKLGMNKVSVLLSEITGETDPEILRTMTMHIHSASYFPILMDQRIKNLPSAPGSISVEKQIDILFDHYFAKYSD